MNKEILITLEPDKAGNLNVEIEAINYRGEQCAIDLDQIAKELNLQTISKKDKREKYVERRQRLRVQR